MPCIKYNSLFSPGKAVSAQQYIAELVCQNNALKKNVDLTDRFWKEPLWYKYYFLQLKFVKKLQVKYDDDVIIKFVQARKIWSLMPKWIDQALYQAQKDKPVLEQTEIETIENPIFKKQTEKSLDFLDE